MRTECQRCTPARSCRLSALSALAAATLVNAALFVPAAAQEAPSSSSQSLCRVFVIDAAEGMKKLLASCNGRGVMLGLVSEFETIDNEALQATLVDARVGDERRILLLTARNDGQPLVEDLAGQIALAAGRGPMSALDGIGLDLEAFDDTGEIGVRPAPEDQASAKADRIIVGEQIALERARRTDAAEVN